MAVAFTNLSWWLWSGKHQEPRISNGSSLNTRPDSDLWESSDTLKFPLVRRTSVASSSRRVKRKWHSREERKIDREYDVVLVPSDGGCFSGTESDDSDYSIGWLEPHGPEFQSDDDTDNSFAVLVPCYGRVQDNVFEDSKNNLFGAVVNIPDDKIRADENGVHLARHVKLPQFLHREKRQVKCCREQQAMHIHGGGRATSGQNIQNGWKKTSKADMEEKVNNMLKIIENSGDSFAQRAEMYYRRRPELINHVEDSYRAYRALAERFDHLSKELQRANRTIATVFPEQVQFSMDDDDDEFDENGPTTFDSDNLTEAHKTSNSNIPKVPSMPEKNFRSQSKLSSRKGQQLNRSASSAKANVPSSSGLSREEAVAKIDKLQREILALQTEKEFVTSVSERCLAKCGGIENQITEMQVTISGLQDEFGISNVIDDNEARTLMASTALKSCKDTLVKLQEKQELSAEEAKLENRRINEVQQKYTSLKGEFLSDQSELQDPADEQEAESEDIDPNDMNLLREKIEDELEADSKSSHTVMQLAGRIDELVEKVVSLETAVSSQVALVNRLKSDTEGLHTHIKTLEEDKETLMESSEKMSNKLKELEEELRRVKCLNEKIKDQDKNLRTRLTEASCTMDHLSVKLQTVKPEEEVENEESIQESGGAIDAEADGRIEEQEEHLASGNNAFISKATEMEKKEKKDDVQALNSSIKVEESGPSQKLAALPDDHDQKDLREAENNLAARLEELGIDEEDQLNWRQPLVSGLDDREKLLLEEYTLVLRNYTEVRKKLGDVEKKNRDGFFELALQIRELKNALALRDEEIESLREISSHQQNHDANNDINSAKYKYSHPEGSPDLMTQAASFLDSNLSSLSSPQQPVFDSEHDHHVEPRGRIGELAVSGANKRYSAKEIRNVTKMKRGDSPHVPSAIEEKIRSDIDGLLEENLEFWLRFSTTLHQIRKFQTSVQDLKVELSRIRERRRRDGNDKSQFIISETRPIFAHMREIQTELTLWLENNSVMKDEMHARYASLCNIQDELSRVSNPTSKAEEAELSEYQAAKFQGEILNMKQESNKVADELQAGLDRVRGLKVEVERILTKLDEELGISASKHRSSSHKARIPLRSFLFGVKLKKYKGQKQSIFSCASPALQKQYKNSDPAAFRAAIIQLTSMGKMEDLSGT
ncbi:unnamed protein product [Dovyalis caffra]|uniref:NAB domain-containing protein n=1 Tax=Dovyalis caffra TaxID=77055 RepID=A0AAV1S6Z5_9ROSI|nr:unnamed protein product [Dovyalis caffra]